MSAHECAASASSDADPVTTAAIDFATPTRKLAPKATHTVLALADTPERDTRESEPRRSVSPTRGSSSAAGLTGEVSRTTSALKADMILVVDSISARRSRLGLLPPRLLRPREQHRSDSANRLAPSRRGQTCHLSGHARRSRDGGGDTTLDGQGDIRNRISRRPPGSAPAPGRCRLVENGIEFRNAPM